MPSDAAYDRDPGAFHEAPGPGPCCCYCQFGRSRGALVLDLPPGWRNGEPVPAERIYHQACRDFWPEYLESGGT